MISVMYVRAEDGMPHELLVEITPLSWAVPGLLEWAEQIVLASICPRESRWGSTFSATRIHSIDVDSTEELDGICRGELSADHPGRMEPGTLAHVVHTYRLTESIVDGDPVQGVCGQWFVPRQDHVSMPLCDVCRTVGEVSVSPLLSRTHRATPFSVPLGANCWRQNFYETPGRSCGTCDGPATIGWCRSRSLSSASCINVPVIDVHSQVAGEC
ncbi:DUF3039 domain-containing protein [Rhodococcoides fascians]|uniref:DUF3039 domain-containing protein n=1 Tax=Rhodococcoides fascians TaxID=1828 RepID=UPI00353020ED